MGSRAVDLSVAGTSCRVVTTADDAELAALAAMVEEKLAAVLKPGRPVTTKAMLLAAIALAHDVRAERARADAMAARARDTLGRLLTRIDEVMARTDDEAGTGDEAGRAPKPERIGADERAPREAERSREPYRVEAPLRPRALDKELGSE